MKAAAKLALTAAAACLLPMTAFAQDSEPEDAMPWDGPGDLGEVAQTEPLQEEQTSEVEAAADEAADVAEDAAGNAMQSFAEAPALEVVEAFMAGLAAKDADAMSAVALDTAFLAFVRPGDDGDAARTMPLSRAIASLAETQPDISEPIRDPVVMADGPVAMVWAPYDFYVGDVRNHCGVNVFSLLRRDGDWRIASVVYSYLPNDCPPEGQAEDQAEDTTEDAE